MGRVDNPIYDIRRILPFYLNALLWDKVREKMWGKFLS